MKQLWEERQPRLPTFDSTRDGRILFGDSRLSFALLGWRRCGWIAALINRLTRRPVRHGNRIAFIFGTWSAYGCAAGAWSISVGRMGDAESQSKKHSGSN